MDKLYMKLADAESAAEVGGKSYMMGRLIRNCEYTPDGIAITIHMMHRFLNLLGVTDGDISAAIALDGEKLSLVRSALKEKPWPAEIKSALREIYDFFDYSVCVRALLCCRRGRKESQFCGRLQVKHQYTHVWRVSLGGKGLLAERV